MSNKIHENFTQCCCALPPSFLQGYQIGDFDDNTVRTGNFLDYEEMTDIFGHKAKAV